MISLLQYLLCFFIFVILQSLFINGVKESFGEGMIFYKIRLFLAKYLSDFWQMPLFKCIRCMSSFWSAITFFPLAIYIRGFMWEEVFIWIFDAGILIYLNYYFFKKA